VVETVIVPDISGLTEQAAAAALTDAGLTVVEVREQPVADKPAGTVISQEPPAGDEVDEATGVVVMLAAVDREHKAKVCDRFAWQALEQNRQNIDNACGLTGAEWSADYGYHFSQCDNAADYQAVTERLGAARQGKLDACVRAIKDKRSFCGDYGDTAVQQYRESVAEKCGLGGARWSADRAGHVNWCLAQGDQYQARASAEQRARSQALQQCAKTNAEKKRACETYAKTAIKQQAKNLEKNCGLKGARWQSDYDIHYNWCVSGNNYKTAAPNETRARQQALDQCIAKAEAPCELYQHANYQGGKYLVGRNKKFDFARQSWNDQVSSVKVPEGCRLTVYVNHSMTGAARTFPAGANPNVGQVWNDQITSGICSCE
jgi:hypothetical protein